MSKFNIPDEEPVIFKLKKSKPMILFIGIICPICLLCATIHFIPTFSNMFLATLDFDSDGNFIGIMISLLIFAPLAIMLPLRCFLSNLALTDKKIYIRSGFGKRIEIGLEDVLAYRYLLYDFRGINIDSFRFILKNGNKVKISFQSINRESINQLLYFLDQKIARTIK